MNAKAKQYIGYGIVALSLIVMVVAGITKYGDYREEQARKEAMLMEDPAYRRAKRFDPPVEESYEPSEPGPLSSGLRAQFAELDTPVEEEQEYESDPDPTPEDLERMGLPVTEPEITPTNYDWPSDILDAHEEDMRRLIKSYTRWLARKQGVMTARSWCESKLFGVMQAGSAEHPVCHETAMAAVKGQ